MCIRVLPVRISNQCLSDYFVLIFIFKLSVVLAAISHHEQISFELLLLSRVEITTILIVTVIFFLFSVFSGLALVFVFIIVAETRLIGMLLTSTLLLIWWLSITKVRLGELLIWRTTPVQHLLLLLHELLTRNALPVELGRIKLHDCILRIIVRCSSWLHGIALRLVLVLLSLCSTACRLVMPRYSIRCHLLLCKEWIGLLWWKLCMLDVRLRGSILTSSKLAPIHLVVLLL